MFVDGWSKGGNRSNDYIAYRHTRRVANKEIVKARRHFHENQIADSGDAS